MPVSPHEDEGEAAQPAAQQIFPAGWLSSVTQLLLPHSEPLTQAAPLLLSEAVPVGVAVGSGVDVDVGSGVGVDVGSDVGVGAGVVVSAGSAATTAATKSSTSDSIAAASPDVAQPRGSPFPENSAFWKAVSNFISAFCRQAARSNDPPVFVYFA